MGKERKEVCIGYNQTTLRCNLLFTIDMLSIIVQCVVAYCVQ